MFRQKNRIWFYREKGIVGNMSSDHFIEQQLPKRKWNGKYLNVKSVKNVKIFWTTMIVNIVYISEKAIVPFYFTLTENKMIFLTIQFLVQGVRFRGKWEHSFGLEKRWRCAFFKTIFDALHFIFDVGYKKVSDVAQWPLVWVR